jgi:type II secretion system protein D
MDRRQKTTLALAMASSAGLAVPSQAFMQESVLAADTSQTTGSPSENAEVADGPEKLIEFNFTDAPYSAVLEFFSRESGLPMIRETEPPEGTMTFISGGNSYSFDEALDILNKFLRAKKVYVTREHNYLYFRTLKDEARQGTDPVEQDGLSEVPDSQIVTITIPLNNASAPTIREKVERLVDTEYGSVVDVPGPNFLIVTETASQCRRIWEIVSILDAELVDMQTELYSLKFAKATDVFLALKELVKVKSIETIIDQKGNKTTQVKDNNVDGMNFWADERTNSILLVGPAARILVVTELIELLDVPGGPGGEREMRTFVLESITPSQAAKSLGELFRAVPDERKPTILPLPEVGKITVVATPGDMLHAMSLMREIDPASSPMGAGVQAQPDVSRERTYKLVRFEYVTPQQAEQIVKRLLTARQQTVLRFTPSPDGRSLIVSGPSSDVTAFEKLAGGIDVAPERDKEFRRVRVAKGDPEAILTEAERLFGETGQATKYPLTISLDSASREIQLIGSREGLSAFETLLRTVQDGVEIETEARHYTLLHAKPQALVASLTRLSRPLLEPMDGSVYVAPKFEALDELDRLIVRAEADQFTVIEELIQQLDQEQPGTMQVRFERVRTGNPHVLVQKAMALYTERTAGMDDRDAGPVNVDVDAATGTLVIRGTNGGLRTFSQSLAEVQQLVPPQRTMKILDIQNVEASEIIAPLTAFLESSGPIDPAREVPQPKIVVIDQTNSLLVTAEDIQHRLISDYVRRLDVIEQTDPPPLRLLQIKSADSAAIAAMLSQQYAKRPAKDRAARPVEVRADTATNTLIVSAHTELYDEIKEFVDGINTQDEDPERQTILFPLKVAKAQLVATAMDKLFPVPPMPRDSRNRPMPWLQKDKEVTVSAESSSNSLIIDAPTERIPSLEELARKLDIVELPPQSELRTYRVIRADLNAVATTLKGMSSSGILSSPAQPGKQAVQVVIEVEPKSSTLIVAGDELTFERVEKVLDDLNEVAIERGLRIIPIINAQADDIRARALTIYNAQIEMLPGANPVDISVNESTNAIEVVGDDEGLSRFVKIVDELQRQAGPPREVRMIELRMAKVSEVIGFLEELVAASESLRIQGGPTPVFEPIETTNSLMVAATASQFPIIESLVKSLDAQQMADRPPLKILSLEVTDATSLANVLQRTYNQRPMDERAKKPVEIQSDAATNTLIVSAHADVLPEIQEIVNELNEARVSDEDREIRIFPLRVARAEDLAKVMDEMYPVPPMPKDSRGRPLPHLQKSKEIFVRADRATNSIIVDAPAKRMTEFDEIVKMLDSPRQSDVEVRTYRIERADLTAVTRTLQELASRGALPQSGQTPVTVNAEPMSRTIVVSGPAEVFAAVDQILKDLDAVPDIPSTSIRMHKLTYARAERIAPLLTDLLTTRLREQQLEEGIAIVDIETLLHVASDAATNTLIISAPDGVQQIAQQIIDALDTEAATVGRAVIRVVPLVYASAGEVSQDLIGALKGYELPSGGSVSVAPARGSNALVLSGASKDLDKIEKELIANLDRQPFDPEKASLETFELEHADATAIAKTVESLLKEQHETDPRILQLMARYQRNRPDLFKQPSIRVEAESRTNSLLVSGPASTIELATAIIERLDRPAVQADRDVITFTPMRADPTKLASSVSRVAQQTIVQERQPFEIVAEPASGSVLVIGSPQQTAQIVRMLTDFDERTPIVPQVEIGLFDVEHSDASSVARMVQTVLNDRTRWPDELRRAEKAGIGVPQPTANADGTRIIVSSPLGLMALAEELIETMDQPKAGGTRDVVVFKLREGDAESVASAVRTGLAASVEAGREPAQVTAEPASNSIVVSGVAEQLAKAKELIGSMDEAVEPSGIGVRTIFLENARADAIAPLIEQVLLKDSVLDQLQPWEVSSYLRRFGAPPEEGQIRVSAEKRLNAIVVSAPTAVLDLAEQIVRELDVARADAQQARPIRVMPLINADAVQLAANIEAVFVDDESGDAPPTIRVDVNGNALIVRATSEQMAIIESLTKELDAATLGSQRQLRMIAVDRSKVDASVMAQTLKRLMEQQGGVKVEVISIDELLNESEKTEDPGESEDVGFAPWGFGLNPADVVVSIASFATAAQPEAPPVEQPVTQPEEGTDSGKAEGSAARAAQVDPEDKTPRIRIAVDPDTNMLVVVGSPRLTDRINELVMQLQSQMPAEATAVRIVPLPENISARDVKVVIDQTVRQVGRASPTNPGGFTGSVVATPDPSGSALIVWANDTDFRSIGGVIGSVVKLDAATRLTVKVYPLENITADRAIRAISDLFSINPRGRQARQVRGLDLTMQTPSGAEITGTLDPSLVRVTADPAGTAVIVAAPGDSIGLIDELIGVMDQSDVTERLSIRRYSLENARAAELGQTFQRLFEAQRQGPTRNEMPRAQFIADKRTNSLLVTASDIQHSEVERLLVSADATEIDDGLELRIITLQNALPTMVEKIVKQVIIGNDPGREDRIQVSAEDTSSVLVVRALPEDMEEIERVVSEIDKENLGQLPVRSISLERADAQTVAQSLQRFFQDRLSASSRTGRGGAQARVAITGDRRSGTLVVAASDDDFAQIESLVATFDREDVQGDWKFEIIPLKFATVGDIEDTVTEIANEIQFGGVFFFPRRGGQDEKKDRIHVRGNDRTNSMVVFGTGTVFDQIRGVIAKLDTPLSDQTKRVVKAIRVEGADLDAIARVIESALETARTGRWWEPDPEAVQVQVDKERRLIMLIGPAERVETALGYVEQLASAGEPATREIDTITLKHAEAATASRSISNFFRDRARSMGLAEQGVTVIGSRDGNVLIVSAEPDQMVVLRDLVARIDTPADDGRRTEVYVLKYTTVEEASATMTSLMDTRGESAVRVMPQPSTNSMLVSATEEQFEQIEILIAQLDVEPEIDNASIVSVSLERARAEDVAATLRSSLPDTIKVKITAVPRTNSIIVSGSPESVKLVVDQIPLFESEPARPAIELRRIQLTNADASELVFNLERLARGMDRSPNAPEPNIEYINDENVVLITAPVEQIETLVAWVAQLDVTHDDDQSTEFVELEYAQAEQVSTALKVFYGPFARQAKTPSARNVSIVADPVTNSLIISANETEWENIRALLTRFDDPKYDTEQTLRLIALKHAEAATVARALNEGFRAPIDAQLQRERIQAEARQRGNRGRNGDTGFGEPTVLIDFEDTPIVSAEPTTNSLIVFASQKQIIRIEKIVEQLDSDEFVRINNPKIIPITNGKPSEIAALIRDTFANVSIRSGPRSLLVVGSDSAGVLIVRADEADFAQVRALADSLQQEGLSSMPAVRTISLKDTPASRLRDTLLASFKPLAQRRGEALSIEVDRSGNRLVVSSSEELFKQIEDLAHELDGSALDPEGVGDGIGQSVKIVDVENNSPALIRQMLNQMGVLRQQSPDSPGVVVDPVQVVPLHTRRAVALVGNRADNEMVASLISAIDVEPFDNEQHVVVVQLTQNEASQVADTLQQLFDVGRGGETAPAEALQEHVRRLNIARNGVGESDLSLDLSIPIRLIPDSTTNSLAIASSAENVAVIKELALSFDKLALGDAVVVRIFALQNADAGRSKRVIDDLFAQGERLARLPGTTRQGFPTTATGSALAGDIAVSVDDRTNALIVAGREEAVAFVEVLISQIDSDDAANWVETRVISLEHAMAFRLAETLDRVIIQGQSDLPEAAGLQRQIARLMVKPSDDPKNQIEADLFVAMTDVIIVPDEQLNALIVVASSANLSVVTELVEMLDVPRASADNTVRIYPLVYAAADRVANTMSQFFQRRESTVLMRPEDTVIISPDLRTNSLIVSTSPSSFLLVESLLKSMDGEERAFTVGIHVLPVEGADVTRLAPKIQTAMQERIRSGQRAGDMTSPLDTFRVESDSATKSLIITSSDENLQIVKDLIAALTSEGASDAHTAEGFEIIPVTTQPPEEIAQHVLEIYVNRENERRGAGTISVSPNARLNALIVSGSKSDIAQIRLLVDQLDAAEVVQERVVQRFELISSDALAVTNLLESILAGPPVGRGNVTGKAAFKVTYNESSMELDAATRAQIAVTPELGTNSIFVQAPPNAMAFIEEVVSSVEQSENLERSIESFNLVNADARQMAEVLGALLNLRRQGERMILIPTQRRDEGDPDDPLSLSETMLTAVPDERQELSITIDARTNTLLVSGTEEYLELVRGIVTELDTIEANERSTLVYVLQNAQADEIETRLQNLYNAESSARSTTLGADESGSAIANFQREVTVVGDPSSNKVIVQTSPRYIEAVEQLIRELDSRPPQVEIQVLLAEVTLDQSKQWGMDFDVADFGGDLYNVGSLAAGAGVASALGVPNLTLSSADFGVMVRSLQAQGRLEVLSKPLVTVNNNASARINVGQNIAIVTGTEFFTQGNSRATVVRQDVGIILEVTPSISSDGYVRLEIAPSISQVSATSDQISSDVSSPRIDTREIETTVTVHDGQTIVIGGLIQTSEVDLETRVPLLSDIPIVGQIFTTTETKSVKTELLVILTPRILAGEGTRQNQMIDSILMEEIQQRSNPETLLDITKAMQRPILRIDPESNPDLPEESAPKNNEDEGETEPAKEPNVKTATTKDPDGGGR